MGVGMSIRNSVQGLAERIGPITLSRRYWDKVEEGSGSECWPWLGHQDPAGYGIFSTRFDGRTKSWRAHRIGYYLSTREEPGEAVRHLCNNPSCNNPFHLANGTLTDNNRDKSILTLEIAQELRNLLAPEVDFKGETYQLKPKKGELIRLAQQLGTTTGAIEGILSGRRWR